MDRARTLLVARPPRDPTWPALAAAAALAFTSVVFATMMVLAPSADAQSVERPAAS